jgi:hypothetical protein
MRRAGAAPTLSFEITPSTKLAFAPAQHAFAFELASASGWFGSSRLVLRGLNSTDVVDWQLAISAAVDSVASAAAITGAGLA